MTKRVTFSEMNALDYLWGGGDEVIECRKVRWVHIRYPQNCMVIVHDGKRKLAIGAFMILETAKVDGQFGSCYTCEHCIRKAIVELRQ